jgi:large subunit ribosomal protein L25
MPTHNRPRLAATPRARSERKSDLKALRRSGQVPASLFGHGEPALIQIPARALREYLHRHAAGALLDLEVEGKVSPAMIRELDRHPTSGEIITLGLQRIDMTETIRAAVPFTYTGEAELVERGLMLERQVDELEVHGRADQIPEHITIDLAGVSAGDTIRIADLKLPEGIHADKDADVPVARITSPSDAPPDAAIEAEDAAHAAEHAAHAAAATDAPAQEAAAGE